jgi:DNA-binding MarR family transcriptional regulator
MARPHDSNRPATRWFDAWRGVLYANAKVLRVAEADLVARFGFPLSWLDVLAQLHDAPINGLRIQELQAGSLFTPSGITRLVDRIEAAGLVRRERVVGDRRGVRVVLTPEGRRRHDEAFRAHLPIIEREFGSRLTVDQQRAVADALSPFWHDDPDGSSG